MDIFFSKGGLVAKGSDDWDRSHQPLVPSRPRPHTKRIGQSAWPPPLLGVVLDTAPADLLNERETEPVEFLGDRGPPPWTASRTSIPSQTAALKLTAPPVCLGAVSLPAT